MQTHWNEDGAGMAMHGQRHADAMAVPVQGSPWCHPPAINVPLPQTLTWAGDRKQTSQRLAYNPSLLSPLQVIVLPHAHLHPAVGVVVLVDVHPFFRQPARVLPRPVGLVAHVADTRLLRDRLSPRCSGVPGGQFRMGEHLLRGSRPSASRTLCLMYWLASSMSKGGKSPSMRNQCTHAFPPNVT